jgi:6-phosphogluconolactonase
MERRASVRRWVAIGVATLLPLIAGCSGFFVPVDNSGGGGGGTTPGTGRVYVANLTTSSISGFTIGTGTLTLVNGAPLSAGFAPISMVVTPNNSFLYVGGLNGLYMYPINSDGSLSTPSTGSLQVVAYATALTVSPDGQWLIELDGTTQVLNIYQINASTGALSQVANPTTYSITAGIWKPTAVTISPSGTIIIASLGTGGDAVFTFNTTTGLAVSASTIGFSNATTGDYGAVMNSATTYAYLARSGANGGVAVYSIASNGILTPVTGSPFAAGTGTYSVVLDNTGTYLYAANRGDGTISGYTIVPGTTTAGLTLTALSGSPYGSGISVQSLAVDSTNKYLMAAAIGGSPDLTMYSFDTTTPGKLDSATTAATDTDPAGAIAVATTH